MKKNLDYYCNKFSNLNVNRHKVRGVAPHKPILLLSILDLIEQKKIKVNQIFLTPNLIATFQKYWSHLGSEQHKNSINLPFYHLKGDRFWHLQSRIGLESVVNNLRSPSLRILQDIVHFAYFDEELFLLMLNEQARLTLTQTLIHKWFSNSQSSISKLFRIDAFQDFQNKLKESGGKIYTVEDLKNEDQVIVRDAAFRKIIVSVYGHQCAFCRLKITNSLGQNIVDGSHIKPFAEFRDDRIDNGLSLCKNHHWAFDHGWFSIDEKYKINVSQNLDEFTPNNRAMKDFEGETIILPNQSHYYPRLEALKWHYENIFQ